MTRGPLRLLCLLVTMLAVLATAGVARAAGARAGVARLQGSGGHAPIVLRRVGEAYSAEMTISNHGDGPLVVSRIAVYGDAADPRVPPRLGARLAEGFLPVTLPPGGSRAVVVEWAPESGSRARQLFGHVVVTTSDEAAGEIAMGVRAQLPGPLGPLESRVLSLLLGVPLLGALAALLAARARRGAVRARRVALGTLALHALLALYIHRTFVPDLARIDGNDGLQFIEHGVWLRALSTEVFLGVDGLGAGALLVLGLVALLALVPDRASASAGPTFHAAYLLLVASCSGALVAMDGLLFVCFAGVAALAAAVLVGASSTGAQRAAARVGLAGLLAVALLAVVVLALGRNADPTFLVDGSRTSVTFSLPELSRVALGAKGAKLLGGPLVKVAFSLVLVASVALVGAFPFHRWVVSVLASCPPAAAALVTAALPAIGAAALLRIGCAVLPEGMQWASGVVVALGAVTAAYGGLGALAQKDLRGLAGYAAVAQVGFVLLGVGSLTPQGIAGAIVVVSTRGLGCGLTMLAAGALEDRARSVDLGRLSGVGAQMPGVALALATAAAVQAGLLGLAGAWGPLFALFGALPMFAPLAVVAAGGLALSAVAHLRALGRVLFAPLDPAWSESPELEALGGRFPDLTAREWLSVAPLATLVVLLGIWPAPIVSVTAGTVRDLTNAVSPPGPDQIGARSAPLTSSSAPT